MKEETPEQELSRKIREFQKERREAFLAGKPYKTTTYEIGFGKNSVPKKISEVLDTSAIIEKPKSSCNNKSIKINQKKREVEEDEEQVLGREVREFKKEMKDAELAGKPFKRDTFSIGGEDEAVVKKVSVGDVPWNYRYGTKGRNKTKTPYNNKSNKRNISNRQVTNNNMGGYLRRKVKPNGWM